MAKTCRGFLKYSIFGPTPTLTNAAFVSWCPRIYISNKFLRECWCDWMPKKRMFLTLRTESKESSDSSPMISLCSIWKSFPLYKKINTCLFPNRSIYSINIYQNTEYIFKELLSSWNYKQIYLPVKLVDWNENLFNKFQIGIESIFNDSLESNALWIHHK